MTIEYDPEADAAYVRVSDGAVSRTEEDSDVCILDLDAEGNLIGIELLSVFGFAGASLTHLAARGIVTGQAAEQVLHELRSEALAA